MPGLTLLMTVEQGSNQVAERFANAQRTMLHAVDYQASTIMSQSGIHIGHVNYAVYPILSFRADGALICVEGCIYNKSQAQIEFELGAMAVDILRDPERARDRVGPWIRESEGEYVVAMADPTRRTVVIFLDPLARLPVYWYANEDMLLLAREAKFVQRLKPRPAIDRVGWTEILALRHVLGRRTLYEDVKSAPGGGLIYCQDGGTRLRTSASSLYTANLDEKDPPGKPIWEHARELVNLWLDRCKVWGSHPRFTNRVLSLSGGKDSRVVAGVMSELKIPLVAATFADSYGVATPDVVCARQLASAMQLDWRLFNIDDPSQEQFEFLVRATDGINPTTNATVLPFLEILRREWGRGAMYITGDGGDFIFPDLRLDSKVKTIDDVVRFFLGFNPAATPVADAEDIMQVPRGTLEAELRDVLNSYPEKQVMQKAIHYRGYERGQNWVYGGEERARFFFWQTSPHYLFSIFERSMRVPDELKAGDALYIEFLRALSPKLAAVPEANYGLPLTSRLRPLKMKLKHFAFGLPLPLREGVRFMLKGRRKPFEPSPDVAAVLRERLRSNESLGRIMNAEAVYRRMGRMSRYEFENFWTLALLEKLGSESAL